MPQFRFVSTAVAAAFLLLAPALAHAADATFDRTLNVKGPVLLGVDTPSGNIRITSGDVATVKIVGHVHAEHGWFSSGNADASVKQIAAAPPIQQAGNIISIGRNLKETNVSIEYEITTPRGTDLRAQTGSGDIAVHDTGGPAQLKTGSGNIDAGGLSARVSLETGSGDIRATLLSPTDVKAQTGSGSITLDGVRSALWAHTGSGNIDVGGRPLGMWRLETGSGNATLNTGSAPLTLDADTGSGSISVKPSNQLTLRDSHASGSVNGGGPAVHISTGSGNITIN